MCVFCAAIPVAASLGAKARSNERHEAEKAIAEGKTPPRVIVPAGTATAMVVTGLAVCSIVYHTRLAGPI